jgi:L-lactate utilization protein LutC
VSRQQEIDDYHRVEAFLADPAVKRAIQKVTDDIFAEFKRAKTTVEMETAWAKSKALDALAGELVATMNGGKIAESQEKLDAQRVAAKEARNGIKR